MFEKIARKARSRSKFISLSFVSRRRILNSELACFRDELLLVIFLSLSSLFIHKKSDRVRGGLRDRIRTWPEQKEREGKCSKLFPSGRKHSYNEAGKSLTVLTCNSTNT